MDLFDSLSIETEESITTPAWNPVVVPNLHPTVAPSTYRLAIVGEAPGNDEEIQGRPFVGQSGRFLDNILSIWGITRACCFVGNVMLVRPPLKKKSQLSPIDKWNKSDIGDLESQRLPYLTSGLEQLTVDIEKFNPHLCFLLGRTALWAAKDKASIDDWRGSVFVSDKPGPFLNRKCLASFHPARCLREYADTALLHFWDTPKAKKEATYKEHFIPSRDIRINLPFSDLCHELNQIISAKPFISYDIEGGVGSLSCIGIATSPSYAIVVPFLRLDGSPYWSVEEEITLWKLIGTIMADRGIHKVTQNGLYDRFVLQYSYNVLVRGNKDDTMLKHFESYCELEKSLGFQASIYTSEPFYKSERKTDDQSTFYTYCGKDACVTYEINQKLEASLTAEQKEHYRFNNEALNFLLYAELKGIRYDQTNADLRLAAVKCEIDKLQSSLDRLASDLGAIATIDWTLPNEKILAIVQETCCYKRDTSRPKKEYEEAGYEEITHCLRSNENLSEKQRQRISNLVGLTLNIQSHKKFQDFLYRTCKLPVQWTKDPQTKELRPTANYEALLKLSKNHSHPVLPICLDLSLLTKRAEMLSVSTKHGRIHCSYNLVGSETGRVTSYASSIPDGHGGFVGTNLQTVPDNWEVFPKTHLCYHGLRDLFLADEGCFLIKCDLKGSDGWTIGAYMAMLGDPTMLDDLKFGLKPAQIVAYILRHGATQIQTYAKDRTKLKELCQEIKKDDWEYFVSKQGIWGTCYTMGPRKLAERVFIESEGKVNLSERQAKDFQSAIYVRYRVKLWQDWMQRFLNTQSYPAKLTASNGQVRRFFGRKTEILGEALAHLPQVYTTYSTLMAATRLWNDPENRRIQDGKTTLIVEPLHQVHDELLMQTKIEDIEWAKTKVRQWFDNPISIANQQITIPFDGAIGTNWAMGETAKVDTL